MARKQVAEYFPAEDDITDVWETNTDKHEGEQTSQKRRLEEIISDLTDSTDDCELRVLKQNNGGKGRMSLLEVFPVDKYTYTELFLFMQDKWGPGDYRIHVKEGNKIRANTLMSIEAPLKSDKKDIVPTATGDAAQMLNVMTQYMQRQDEKFERMMEIIAQRNDNDESEEKVLKKLALYKGLFGGNSGGLGQIQESIGFLKELGLTPGLPAPQEKEEGFIDIIDKMAPIFQSIVEAKTAPQPQQKQETPKVNIAEMKVKFFLGTLLTAASNDSDPMDYAQMVIDMGGQDMVKKYVVEPDSINQLIKMEPKVNNFKNWFLELAEHVKYRLGLESTVAGEYEELTQNNDNDITPSSNGGNDEPELST